MYIIIYIKFKFLSLVEESDVQGVPKNMGIQWLIRYCLCYELQQQYLVHAPSHEDPL